jgi:hypothetical protein
MNNALQLPVSDLSSAASTKSILDQSGDYRLQQTTEFVSAAPSDKL